MNKTGAIILAAGKGTRMKAEKAKVVFKLAEKEMIRRVSETALRIDCDPVGVVVGYKKETVMAAIPADERISFIEQKEQNGTGHAVMVCAELFKDFEGDLLILCGDIPLLSEETLQRLLSTHRENEAACTVLTIKLEDPASYGRIIRDGNDQVVKIVEYKDATLQEKEIDEINTGIYCFDSKLLFSSLHKIDNNNNQQEYYLTDTLGILNGMGKKVIGLVTRQAAEVTGINSQIELSQLEDELYARIKDYWLTNGVTIENPASVIIGEDVELQPEVEIGAGVIIKGKTRISRGAVIGAYSYLEDARIGEGAVLKGFNIVKGAEIETGSLLSYQEMWLND